MSDYPLKLIPDCGCRVVDRESLMSHNGLWLVRHVDSRDREMFIGNSNMVAPECINIVSNHLRDLSNNLLGVFEADDVCWGIAKEYADRYTRGWDGEEHCSVPEPGHYFRDDDRGKYYIEVDALLDGCVAMENADGQQKEYHFEILHTPTVSNYWHVSIRVYNEDNLEVSCMAVSKGQLKRIWKTMKDYLVSTVVTVDCPEDYAMLAPTVYHK